VDVTNRQFDITFTPQSTVGDYTLVVGPHIADMAGNELDQDRDRIPGENGDDDVTVTFMIVRSNVYDAPSLPLSIGGFDSWGSYLTIADDLPIGDVNVKINVSFPRAGNLSIWLVSPWGQKVRLSYRHGGSSKDFNNTLFDDSASKPIST